MNELAMKKYIEIHPWKIIETDFSLNDNMVTESLLAIGNGRMGQRAVFEETFTGETLRGSYLAGIYYPDKGKVYLYENVVINQNGNILKGDKAETDLNTGISKVLSGQSRVSGIWYEEE